MLFFFRAGVSGPAGRRSPGRCTTGRTERNVRQKTTADVRERSRGTTATDGNPTLSYAATGDEPLIGVFLACRPRRAALPAGPCHRAPESRAPDPLAVRKDCMNQQLADRLHFLRAFAANP